MLKDVPREAVWIMALFVAFMIVGVGFALLVPHLFGPQVLQPVSPPASPPPALP